MKNSFLFLLAFYSLSVSAQTITTHKSLNLKGKPQTVTERTYIPGINHNGKYKEEHKETTVYIFNENGNLKEHAVYNAQDSLKWSEVIEYENDLPLRKKFLQKVDTDWKEDTILNTVYTYYNQGKETTTKPYTKMIKETSSNVNTSVQTVEVFVDDHYREVEAKTDAEGSIEDKTVIKEFINDGLNVITTVYDAQGTITDSFITTFNKKGALVSKENDAGICPYCKNLSWKYNEMGDVILFTAEQKGAPSDSSNRFEYTYDENGNWSKCLEFKDGKLNKIKTRTYNY